MKIERVPLSELVMDPSNVRKHSGRNIEAIKGSLAKFGQQKPIVVGSNGVVVAGNGTLAAARELGWADIAVQRTELQGADATAYAIADNRTADLAEWAETELAEALCSLRLQDAELAAAAGYSDAEIDALVAGVARLDEGDTSPQLDGLEYRVVIKCDDEQHQYSVLEKLAAEGYECSALIS